jgi:hypothetical protein
MCKRWCNPLAGEADPGEQLRLARKIADGCNRGDRHAFDESDVARLADLVVASAEPSSVPPYGEQTATIPAFDNAVAYTGEGLTVKAQSFDANKCHGGTVRFVQGHGCAPTGEKPQHGQFIWELGNGVEFMRVDGDGMCYLRGQPVREDAQLFQSLSDWLAVCKTTYDRPGECTLGAHSTAGPESESVVECWAVHDDAGRVLTTWPDEPTAMLHAERPWHHVTHLVECWAARAEQAESALEVAHAQMAEYQRLDAAAAKWIKAKCAEHEQCKRDLAEARMMAVARADHHRAFEAWIMQEPMDTLHPDSVLARSMWREREPKLSSEQRALVNSWRDAERKDGGK